jgi:hypothetical protein
MPPNPGVSLFLIEIGAVAVTAGTGLLVPTAASRLFRRAGRGARDRCDIRPLGISIERFPSMWYGTPPLGLARASVAARLSALPDRQLAIVRYGANHNPLDDRVYNEANIDGAKIVWAREMAREQTAELIDYYRDRLVWLTAPRPRPNQATRMTSGM